MKNTAKSTINADILTTITENAVIIIPLATKEELPFKQSEIESLTYSAGANVKHVFHQVIREISSATFIGKGKLLEIADYITDDIDIVIFDGDLSPSQTLNISKYLKDVKVIDRTTLILDIFALSAFTSEGKLQVELAQLRYNYPRLKGKGIELSRLGGGIGTRGPGESQLETDRRHIRSRILNLEKELEKMQTRRELQRQNRAKSNAKIVSLVGYTNTGKSSLLNALTSGDVLVKDKLFATLDPTARRLDLGDFEVVMIDTVGFIRNIPTHLIKAFKSTLESANESQLILNVIDCSTDIENQIHTTHSILNELNVTAKIVNIYNKVDKVQSLDTLPNGTYISVKNNFNIEEVKQIIKNHFINSVITFDLELDYKDLSELLSLKNYIEKYDISYLDTSVKVNLTLSKINLTKFEKFINKE